jgi:hypothetical protein
VLAALTGLQQQQQQQQQQWRSMSAAADSIEGLLQQQRQQRRQQLQTNYGVQQRSEFEGELLACTTVDRLAALVRGLSVLRTVFSQLPGVCQVLCAFCTEQKHVPQASHAQSLPAFLWECLLHVSTL